MPFNPLQYPISNMMPRMISQASTWVSHIPFAFTLMQMARPTTFVELETLHGDSYLAFCQAVMSLQLLTKCSAVDMWPNDPQAGYHGDGVLAALKAVHDPEMSRFSRLIRGSFDQAANQFAPVSIDLLHMDGNPSYVSLRHDFQIWFPKLSDRGIVLLHGINQQVPDGGARKLWAELSPNRPHFAFEHAGGLGIVALGSAVPTAVLSFLRDAATDPRTIQAYFARLGQTLEIIQAQRRIAAALVNIQTGLNDWKKQAGHWIDPKGIDVTAAYADTPRFAASVGDQVRFALNDDVLLRKQQRSDASGTISRETPAATSSFSVIVCSIDDAKFQAIDEMYRRLLKDRPTQIIRISDAKSMCEGYNRGIAQSTGDVLIFSHDDIEILNEDFADRLLGHLAKFDLVGLAGTTRVCSGHWVTSGPPYLFGQVTEPAPQGGYLVQLFGGDGPVCDQIQVVDGLMFAVHRRVVEKIRFDESFNSFHLYDLDFSAQAFTAGYKLAVARDIWVIHASHGSFDQTWKQHASQFEAKWSNLLQPNFNRQFHVSVVIVKSRDEVIEVMKSTS